MLLAPLLAAALSATPAPAAPPRPQPQLTPDPGVELAGPELGAVREPSAPGAWGGPRTGREPTLSDRVASYVLRAELDPVKHTIEGTERLTWRNRSALPIRSLYLHLYLNAFESEGSLASLDRRRFGDFRYGLETEDGEWGSITLRSVRQGGRDARWAFVHPDGGPDTDHTVIQVELPEAVPPGGTAVVDLAFHDRLPRVVARSGWFDTFHMVGQWYPKVGVLELPGERGATRPRWNCHAFHMLSEFYADFGSYDLEVVVPEGYVVGAVGALAGAPARAGGRVTYRFRADDVHDVAFVAWNGFAPPLEATWTGPGSPPVKVTVLHPPEFERSARETLQANLDALTWFSKALGPYPYPTSTVVIPPYNAEEAGGMEYETFYTSVGANEGYTASPGMARYVAVHEFGHGYFMGILASNEFEEPLLDEGVNEWLDVRMIGDDAPALDVIPAPLRWLGVERPRVRHWDVERAAGRPDEIKDPISGNAWHRWSAGSYFLIYPRSVLVFEDLAAQLGQETADRAMRRYYEQWRFRHPSTADLRQAWLDVAPDAAARATVDRWFEEQVYRGTPLDDRVVALESRELLPELGLGADGAELTAAARDARVEQAREAWRKAHGPPDPKQPGPFPFRTTVSARRKGAHVPRALEVTFEDGTTERLAWPAGEAWGRWELDRPVRASEARLAPPALLIDANRLDDGRTREAHPGTSAGLALAAEGWLRYLYALVGAL
ncbi:MAG: hypothetical protein QM767_29645 [Anaeromyxobacter sp.]